MVLLAHYLKPDGDNEANNDATPNNLENIAPLPNVTAGQLTIHNQAPPSLNITDNNKMEILNVQPPSNTLSYFSIYISTNTLCSYLINKIEFDIFSQTNYVFNGSITANVRIDPENLLHQFSINNNTSITTQPITTNIKTNERMKFYFSATGFVPNITDPINDKLRFSISNIKIYGDPIAPNACICFPMSTPITTGHGPIPIERLDPLIHTIRGKRIVDVVSVVSDDRYLVCFEQDSLGKNLPSAKTIMSKEHKILWKGRLRPADEFVDLTDGIYKVRYNGELLYNVLMETYDCMMVNGLICETLDPANDVAELYKALRHLEPNERADYIDEINGYRKYLQR